MALYDSIANEYDATRGYPPGVQEQVGQKLRDIVNKMGIAQPRYLEIGAGSGRIGLPIAAAGERYVGADESGAMLGLFAARLKQSGAARANLVQADAKRLPFAAASFDVGLAVHVFHLVGGWRAAADEFRRVVRGALLLGFDIEEPSTAYAEAQAVWGGILDEANVPRQQQGREQVGAMVVDYLARQGGRVARYTLFSWEEQFSGTRLLHDQRYGGFCRTRTLPDADFDRYIGRLRDWLVARHGSEDVPLQRRQTFEVYVVKLGQRIEQRISG